MHWFAIAALSTVALAQHGAAAVIAPIHQVAWPGWKGVKYLFVFGDSYTTTGFNVNGTQPNDANPLGNPAYPGRTSANGPNWIDFLTTTYNRSKIYTYNLAYGGATVDSDLVKPYLPTVLSLKDQVNKEFIPTYASHPPFAPWSSNNTLFAFWIGINDVGNSYLQPNLTGLYSRIIAEYRRNIGLLYGSGAKNFLFLLVPPVQRSPLTLGQSSDPDTLKNITEREKAAIFDFNTRVNSMVDSFNRDHNDTTIIVYDSYTQYDRVLSNVTVYPQTAGLKNTTSFCDAYANGTPQWNSFNASCGVPVDQYFWLNSLHPTYPMHNATAADVVKFIELTQPGPTLRYRSPNAKEISY